MQKYVCTVCHYEYDPAVGDRIMEFNLEQRLKICLKTGLARFVQLAKTCLKLNKIKKARFKISPL